MGTNTSFVQSFGYQNKHPFHQKVLRGLWTLVWHTLFRPSPRAFHGWRRFLLRCFGAQISSEAHVYPSCRIWAPWNLSMEKYSCLGDYVHCYSVDKVRIGEYSTISQFSFLCTASHDYNDFEFPLVTAPIDIGQYAWIAADVFIGPGVTVAEGAVVGARASVFKDVEPWVVVVGNPAKFIKKRRISANN